VRKLLLVFINLLICTVFITGCSNQATLNNKIQSLENEIREMRLILEQVNSISIVYQEYKDKVRFVPKESQIYALPIKGLEKLNSIEANTVIQVVDSAQCQDQQLWLYVSVPVYDTPINFKGWIPESETIKLTQENVKQVQGDVSLKEGTPIYEVDQFNEISTATATKISYDVRGRIEKREGSFVYIIPPGGWYFWVEEEYLIFPKVE